MAETGNEHRPDPEARPGADTAGEHALPSEADVAPRPSGHSPRHALPDDMQPYQPAESRAEDSATPRNAAPQSTSAQSTSAQSTSAQSTSAQPAAAGGPSVAAVHPHPAYEDYEPPSSPGVEPAVFLSALLAGLIAAWVILRGRSPEDES